MFKIFAGMATIACLMTMTPPAALAASHAHSNPTYKVTVYTVPAGTTSPSPLPPSEKKLDIQKTFTLQQAIPPVRDDNGNDDNAYDAPYQNGQTIEYNGTCTTSTDKHHHYTWNKLFTGEFINILQVGDITTFTYQLANLSNMNTFTAANGCTVQMPNVMKASAQVSFKLKPGHTYSMIFQNIGGKGLYIVIKRIS